MELLADVSLLPGEERITGECMLLSQSQVKSSVHSVLKRCGKSVITCTSLSGDLPV